MRTNTLGREIVEETNNSLARLFGVKVHRESYSRPSTLKAKTLFGDVPVRVIEIGCGRGKNARDICETLNVSEFFVVDPFEKYAVYKDYNREYLAGAEEEARRRLAKFGDKVKWIKDYSGDAVRHLTGTFDFIYVDGNHDYEFVLDDMQKYFALLKPRAVFGGHDIDQIGVTKAFITFVYENKFENIEVGYPDWTITIGA